LKISYELNDLDFVANQLIENVETKILLFYGDMGVGKTTLIKAIVKALGSSDEVSSPTFSIVNEYELENDKIFHFDLYRIKDLEEAYNFGIEDYIYSDNWLLIEWPQKIESILIDNYNQIELNLESKNKRNLKIEKR